MRECGEGTRLAPSVTERASQAQASPTALQRVFESTVRKVLCGTLERNGVFKPPVGSRVRKDRRGLVEVPGGLLEPPRLPIHAREYQDRPDHHVGVRSRLTEQADGPLGQGVGIGVHATGLRDVRKVLERQRPPDRQVSPVGQVRDPTETGFCLLQFAPGPMQQPQPILGIDQPRNILGRGKDLPRRNERPGCGRGLGTVSQRRRTRHLDVSLGLPIAEPARRRESELCDLQPFGEAFRRGGQRPDRHNQLSYLLIQLRRARRTDERRQVLLFRLIPLRRVAPVGDHRR